MQNLCTKYVYTCESYTHYMYTIIIIIIYIILYTIRINYDPPMSRILLQSINILASMFIKTTSSYFASRAEVNASPRLML